MERKFVLSNKTARSAAMMAAFAMMAGVAANAGAATLYGGGATLPAVGYEGSSAALSDNRQTNPVTDTHSLLGNWAGGTSGAYTVSYCQTGSGTGRKVLQGPPTYSTNTADAICPTFSSGTTPLGFAALPSGTTDPNFAASDVPLSQTEYSQVISNKGTTRTEAVQFPSLAGAIALSYSNTSVSGTLNLTDDQICKIFSGQITNWSSLGYASKALTVIYRSDGSGTTFSFSNHLNTVCTHSGSGGGSSLPAGKYFTADQTFTTAAATAGYMPAAGNGVSGNPGVVTKIYGDGGSTPALDGSIGYAEVADAVARVSSPTFASVESYTGTAFISPTSLPSLYPVSVSFGKVVTVSGTTGQATLASVTGGSHSATCLAVVDPTSYANSASNYPIVGVTYLLGYYAGNGTVAAGVTGLLKSPYTASTSIVTDIKTANGLVFLKDNSTSSRLDLSTNVGNCVF